MTVVVSPFIAQVGRAESYISIEEFKFSASAAAGYFVFRKQDGPTYSDAAMEGDDMVTEGIEVG